VHYFILFKFLKNVSTLTLYTTPLNASILNLDILYKIDIIQKES
jgi:hypothetical protein